MPLNVDLAECTIESKGNDTEKIGTLDAKTNEGTNDKDMEESPLFEMDMDPNACNQSVSDTMHEKHNIVTSGEGTFTEQDRCKDPITIDDKTDAVSKHVLSTNLDNVSPSDKCTICDKTQNPEENCVDSFVPENRDGTEV